MRFYDALDWPQPWYAAIRDEALPVASAPNWRDALNARAAALRLRNQQGHSIAFVPQETLPEGQAYEAFIHATGQVPTRENLHDFFNALVWLNFPKTKVQLNALQAAQIARDGIGKSRGPARDGATLFDENAALVVVREAAAQGEGSVIEALRSHQWNRLFINERERFGVDWAVWLFGHALMEKLAAPYKAITAHALIVPAPDAFFSWPHDRQRTWLDEQAARDLQECGVTPARFTPLPVLGLPGWWPQQDGAFYADAAVFRPPRVRQHA